MNKKINILHVVTGLDDGGLEKIVFMLVSQIRKENIQHFTAVLTPNSNSFLEKDFEHCGVVVKKFNFSNRFNSLKSLILNLSQTLCLAKYIKENDIQIIHSHDFFPALTARVAAVFSMLFFFHKVDKIFITLHNLFFWLNPIHHQINKILSKFTTKIICVSRSVMNYSIQHDNINLKKYKIIYNGVDVSNYIPNAVYNEQYRKEFKIKNNEIVIANVGVLSVRKGHKYLLEAFKRLLDENKNIKLLIFGSEREHEKEIAEEIYKIIDEYKINEKVQIISPRKDLNKIYNIFDVFVMPSITEGLSLSAIEAMLMQKVCLFSDIPPFKEMISDGENGYLFKSKNSYDLYIKLKMIINNSSNKKVSENARLQALEKYDVQRMCNEYYNLYIS